MHGLSWVSLLKIQVFLTAFEGSIMLYSILPAGSSVNNQSIKVAKMEARRLSV